MEPENPWICEHCAEPCTGDMCLRCGAGPPFKYDGPAAGSLPAITGVPPTDSLGARLLLPFYLMMLTAVLFGIAEMIFGS